MSPTTWMANAPMRLPRMTASGTGKPSSMPLMTPTAKPSPAPTVSTTSFTGTPATLPSPSLLRQ